MLNEQEIGAACLTLIDPVDACVFRRVDLHVHSPASHDFAKDEPDGKVRATLKAMDSDEFVALLAEQGLEMVAVTDHNTGAFIDDALAAAK